MYRSFKILFITSIAVYIFSNEAIVSVKDAHAKILSPIWNYTKTKNVNMSETVSLHNIKWTLRVILGAGLREIEIMSTTGAESANKYVDRAQERDMTTVLPVP